MPHVHHKNGQKDDNRPENLQPLTPLEHGTQHSRIDYTEARALYESGWNVTKIAPLYGVHYTTLEKGLKKRGVKMRGSRWGRPMRRQQKQVAPCVQ